MLSDKRLQELVDQKAFLVEHNPTAGDMLVIWREEEVAFRELIAYREATGVRIEAYGEEFFASMPPGEAPKDRVFAHAARWVLADVRQEVAKALEAADSDLPPTPPHSPARANERTCLTDGLLESSTADCPRVRPVPAEEQGEAPGHAQANRGAVRV